MKMYLITQNFEVRENALRYVIENRLPIPKENVCLIEDERILSEAGVLFFAQWKSPNGRYAKILKENKAKGGYNVSLGKMEEGTEYIDEILEKPRLSDFIKIAKNYSRGYRKMGGGSKVLALQSLKGGVGKSSLALALTHLMGLVKGRNKRVLLIDGDIENRSLTRHFRDFYGNMVGTKTLEGNNLIDLLKSYEADFNYTKFKSSFPMDISPIKNPIFIGSDERLNGVDLIMSANSFFKGGHQIKSLKFLRELFLRLDHLYDYIIIDTPSGGNFTLNRFLSNYASKLLYVLDGTQISIDQLRDYVELEKEVKGFDICTICLSKSLALSSERIALSLRSQYCCRDSYHSQVFNINGKEGARDAFSRRDTIFNKKEKYLSSSNLNEYGNILYRILNHCFEDDLLPLPDLGYKNSFLSNLMGLILE